MLLTSRPSAVTLMASQHRGVAVIPHVETLTDKRIIIHLDDATVYGPLDCSSATLALAHCVVKLSRRVAELEDKRLEGSALNRRSA